MRIVCAEEEKDYWHTQQELLCRGVLVSVVDLLPHIKVVISSCVELERHSSDIVKHQVGAKHVADVGECPRNLLGEARHDVEQYLEGEDEDKVDGPGA